MIKVLGLALYGPLAASNRYRLSNYIPGLANYEISLETRYLLGDDYLRARFNDGRFPIASMLKSGLSRLEDLIYQNKFDIIMLQCELFPLLPGWFERLLISKPYIYDFDDAFYLKYQSKQMRFLSPILAKKFESVIAGAAAVTAGNKVLQKYASQHNSNTYFLPTVVDIKRYLPQIDKRGNQMFTVGWIGSPSTALYLNEIIDPLKKIGKEGPVKLIVIGGKAPVIPNITVMELDWNEKTEIDLINSFDVGIMPLPNDEWARGKCAFKLIQYMACSLPVIASAVGANTDVVNSECGLLVSSSEEWIKALRILRNDSNKRKEMGEAGRSRVMQHYSLQQNIPILANVITSINKEFN